MLKNARMLLVIVALTFLIVAPTLAQEPMGVGGDATGVVYEMKESIYGGEPITLSIWDWHLPRIVLWEKWTQEYSQMYPNVSFEISQTTGDEYWTKATAAIPAGEGPDLMHFHNAQHTPFTANNLIEPFPEAMFDPAYLEENWLGFSSQHFHDTEGQIRYIPYGSMAAEIYINTGMWEAAGLTEADYPATWDDLLTLAEKLTVTDAAGNIDIAGFAFNGVLEFLWNDMNFQQGRYMYTADGTGCQVDTPEGRRSLETILGFYDANTNSRDFLGFIEAFGTEKGAMTWSWTWFSDYLRNTYPDLEFFTVKMPTFGSGELPSLGRQNYEVSLVVPSGNEPERAAAAWDFMHWLYSQDEKLVDLALSHQIAPSYRKLFDNPRILADETIHHLTEVMEYKVFPGEFPTTMGNALTQYIAENTVAGATVDESLPLAEEACDLAMQEQQYWVVEHSYVHDDAMIADQP
jgi:multiple sugar transport system substrate-binding protein